MFLGVFKDEFSFFLGCVFKVFVGFYGDVMGVLTLKMGDGFCVIFGWVGDEIGLHGFVVMWIWGWG